EDMADGAATRRRSSPIVRLHRSLIREEAARATLGNVLAAIDAGEPNDSIVTAIDACLDAISAASKAAPELKQRHWSWRLYPDRSGLIVEAPYRHDREEDQTVCEGRPITLASHSQGVRDYAR